MQMTNNAKFVRFSMLVLCALSLLSGPLGCRSEAREGVGPGLLVSTRLALPVYVQHLRAASGKGAQFFFPELKVYDQHGKLVYSSHESIENARVLRDIPASISNLRPLTNAAQLTEIVDEMPDFRAHKAEILGQNRVSVVSVFLENCHACEIQEDALSDVQRHLINHGTNLLVIRVSRP
jgi:hypothetical protein